MNNIIETERLVLRPLTLADADTAYHGWTGDPEVAEYVSWLPHHSIDDTIEWLKEIEWRIPNDNYIWGFVLKETGELFGSGGLIWKEDWQLFQVGYNIKKNHWNRGYTTEAMKAILSFAAVNLGIKRVAGGHAKENLSSAKVLEKLGFVYDRDDITPHVDGTKVFDSREYYLDLDMSYSIRSITENKEDFLPLLFLSDESENQICKYLERGELFALYDGNLKCVCIVTDEGGGTLEIQNIATDERYQRQGYASKLIEHIAGHYKNRYNKIILGTGDVPWILTFYERCGFRQTHRVPDYFTEHYDHPIIEDGVLLKDKVYMERKL